MSSGQLWAAVAVIVIGNTIALLYLTHYVDKRIEDLSKRLGDLRDFCVPRWPRCGLRCVGR